MLSPPQKRPQSRLNRFRIATYSVDPLRSPERLVSVRSPGNERHATIMGMFLDFAGVAGDLATEEISVDALMTVEGEGQL